MKHPNAVPQEIELKLEVEPRSLDDILAHPLLNDATGEAPRTQFLHSTYFDTPDHALRQAGISFRIRRNGEQRIQTIKAPSSRGGIAMTRNEWEQEVAGDEPDFRAATGTALEPFLELRHSIRPVFSVSAERTLRELFHGSSVIEVAADRGRIEGNSSALSFGELELELKTGGPEDLFDLALRLAEAAPLRLSFMTKAERGYVSGSAEPTRRVKAGPVILKRKMTSAAAFQTIGASCLRHLMANEAIVRNAGEADAVHQMRVALRRLRAAVTLFKTVVQDDRQDRIRADLKWMAGVLGEARDLDVHIATVLEPAQAEHGHDEGYAELLADYRKRREQAYEKVQQTISSARFINGILETAAWIQAGPWLQNGHKASRQKRKRSVVELAQEELERRWRRILKRGRHLAELAPEDRHQVRIEIKKLRYAAEFFESLFKHKGAKKKRRAVLSGLEALQETLGELNDIAVGSEMTSSTAADAIRREQLSRIDELVATAETQYRDLARSDPFWLR
jgi:triphosphatase